jgi:hypothetical protein
MGKQSLRSLRSLLNTKVFAILVAVLVSGCSTTSGLTNSEDANRKVGDGNATLNLRSGRSCDGREFQFGKDSTRFKKRTDDSVMWVPTKDISSVKITDRSGGALEGLMLGGFGGAGVGLLAGSGTHSGGDDGMGKGLLLMATTFVGATGGLVFGAIKGHDYTFMFSSDSLKVEPHKSIQRDSSVSRVEARVGWETNRQSIVGILGYVVPLGASWSFVPELNFVGVATPAVSARYEVPISDKSSFCILGGIGVTFPPFPPPITGIVAVSAMLKTNDNSQWSIEARIIAPALDYMHDYKVGGTLSTSKIRSLLNYPPFVVSIGFEF